MNRIKKILMERDGVSAREAEELISEAHEALLDALENGDDAYEICNEYFGLEPDYLEELI